jgi:hypothetical protein
VVPPGLGRLDDVGAEDPTPPAKQVNNPVVDIKVFDLARTFGQGSDEATRPVGEDDAGRGSETRQRAGNSCGWVSLLVHPDAAMRG